jgi:hypothetical protein
MENLINAGYIVILIILLSVIVPLWMVIKGGEWIILIIYLFFIVFWTIILLLYYPFWNGYIYLDDNIIKFREWGFFSAIYSRVIELSVKSELEIIYQIKQYKEGK